MYSKTVFDNGVRIISQKIEHVKSVALGIWVNTGSRDETQQKNGISHFIEHMIFKGTSNRTSLQIAKELDAIGGLSNAFTGKENTCFYTKVLGKHLTLAADLLTDIFFNATFTPEDIDMERLVILQEINMVEDTPDDNIHELFNNHVWAGHPVGMSVLGTAKSVSAIQRNNLLHYIDNHYIPENIIIAACGDVEHQEMVSLFQPFFDQLEKKQSHSIRTPPVFLPVIKHYYKDLEQIHLCLGGESPSHKDPARFACSILNTILGGSMSSHLFQEIREKRGLAYSIFSFLSSYVDTGMMGIYVAMDQENITAGLEIIHSEIKKIIKGQLTEEELQATKEHLIGGVYLAMENTSNIMMRIAKNELVFQRYVPIEELISNIKKVTIDEVIEKTENIFQKDLSLITLGPLPKNEIDKQYLKFK